MAKTVEEWLDYLPKDVQLNLINNQWNCSSTDKFLTLDDMINEIFRWPNTNEGEGYWSDIYNRAYDGEFDKPLNQPPKFEIL